MEGAGVGGEKEVANESQMREKQNSGGVSFKKIQNKIAPAIHPFSFRIG